VHPNEQLLERLYSSLRDRDAAGMATCYAPDATFRDIAFELNGINQIQAMWDMVCRAKDFRASFDGVRADDAAGSADVVDDYIYGDTGAPVHNVIHSEFVFRNGLIVEHRDSCDALVWGRQALGPVKGIVTWLVPALRRSAAKTKLAAFIDQNRAYP
jgi:ketosteroid isomerase-like protein